MIGLGQQQKDIQGKNIFELHNKLSKTEFYRGKQQPNKISDRAIIAETVVIIAHDIIIEDDVEIEDFVVIFPHVTINKVLK